MFSSVSLTRAATRACASAGILPCNSRKFFALAIVLFPFQFSQMFIIWAISNGNELLIPPGVSGLLAANEQDSLALWIKSVQNAVRTTFVLDAQLAHVCLFAAFDA